MLFNSVLVFIFLLCAAALGLIVLTFFAVLAEVGRYLDVRDARRLQASRETEKVSL